MAGQSKTGSHQPKRKSATSLQPARLEGDKLKQLYSTMLHSRLLAQKLQALEQQGWLDRASVPASGHEAIPVGMLVDLRPNDRVVSGPHSVASWLVRSQPVKSIVAEVLGCKRAFSTRAHAQAFTNIIPSHLPPTAQINIALGAAWAFKTQGGEHVAINLCREDSITPAEWRDAINFSVLHKLAVIHVVQTGSGEGPVADGHFSTLTSGNSDLPTLVIDGHDVIAVYRVGQEAVRRARQGHGPALIVCQTTAWASNASMNLSVNSQNASDPVARMEGYLQRKGLWSERWHRGLLSGFARELERAAKFAQKSRLRLLPSDRTDASMVATG